MKVTETPPAVPAPRSPVTKTAAPAVEPHEEQRG